jgi:hypothetical protein
VARRLTLTPPLYQGDLQGRHLVMLESYGQKTLARRRIPWEGGASTGLLHVSRQGCGTSEALRRFWRGRRRIPTSRGGLELSMPVS